MKRVWMLILCLLLVGNFCTFAYANGTDSFDTGDLLRDSWEENGTTPDYVTYTWGDPECVTIGIVQSCDVEQAKAQIRDWVADDDSYQFVIQPHSREELRSIKSLVEQLGAEFLVDAVIEKEENWVKVRFRDDARQDEEAQRLFRNWYSQFGDAVTLYWNNEITGEQIKFEEHMGTPKPPETDATEPPVTEPPVTEPPVTEPPVTEPPVTEPPVTEPPVTEPPVTEPPVTEPPVTEPPVTEPPVTEPPVTEPPVTEPPVTEPPVTEPPVTEPPVTEPPVTEPPVTEPPVTEPPVTEPPVTEPPVTEPPVTEPPVTEPPVTEPPVTEPPVTEPPVTEPPVTEPPTEEPTEEPTEDTTEPTEVPTEPTQKPSEPGEDSAEPTEGANQSKNEVELKISPLANSAVLSIPLWAGGASFFLYEAIRLLRMKWDAVLKFFGITKKRKGTAVNLRDVKKMVSEQPPAGPSSDLDQRIFESIRNIQQEKNNKP